MKNAIVCTTVALLTLMSASAMAARPQATMLSPLNGATLSGTITVAANAWDPDPNGSVTRVDFYVGRTLLFSDTNGADGWSFSWDTTTTPNGFNRVAAIVTDNTGQRGGTASYITVSNGTPPTVTWQSHATGDTLSGTELLEVNATDDVGVTAVEFYLGGVLLGTDTDGTDGWSYSFDTTNVTNGAERIVARALDTDGLSAIDPIYITITNP